MDGFEVAARLREMTGLKGAVLIALSGYSKEQAGEKHAGNSLFDHHLVKPVDPDILKKLLQMMEK
jgi:two-component system CheB/CheR fusion protein